MMQLATQLQVAFSMEIVFRRSQDRESRAFSADGEMEQPRPRPESSRNKETLG